MMSTVCTKNNPYWNNVRLFLAMLTSCLFIFCLYNYSIGSFVFEEGSNYRVPPSDVHKIIDDLLKGKRRLIDTLKTEVRLLCWIMTDPGRVEYRTAIMETWGKRCHLTLFMAGAERMLAVEKGLLANSTVSETKGNITSPAIPPKARRRIAPNAFLVYLDIGNDTYQKLWSKTRHAFVYVREHFPDAYDWVLKADDDAFVIVENLRLFLRDKNPNGSHYFGSRYTPHAPEGYLAGGPGYVMSREAVDQFVAQLKRKGDADDDCLLHAENSEGEDVKVAQCLHRFGVSPTDARDELGRFRFVYYSPEQSLTRAALPGHHKWYMKYLAYELKEGFECCSDTAISFHYNTPTMMRVLEYFTYYATPFNSRDLWNYTYTVSD